MSKRRKKKKYPATLKLLCTVTVLLLGAACYTFGNDGITPISDTVLIHIKDTFRLEKTVFCQLLI